MLFIFFLRKLFILGSEKPAEVKGRARLYSMVVCPFVMGIHAQSEADSIRYCQYQFTEKAAVVSPSTH